MSRRIGWVLLASFGVAAGVGVAVLTSRPRATSAAELARQTPTPRQLIDALPGELTAELPGDVDRALQKTFLDNKQFAAEQLLFDLGLEFVLINVRPRAA